MRPLAGYQIAPPRLHARFLRSQEPNHHLDKHCQAPAPNVVDDQEVVCSPAAAYDAGVATCAEQGGILGGRSEPCEVVVPDAPATAACTKDVAASATLICYFKTV